MTWAHFMLVNQLRYKSAYAAGTDAGNHSMKKGGRTEWNEDDWNAACTVFDNLCPERLTP
jgi:hypothetical protein